MGFVKTLSLKIPSVEDNVRKWMEKGEHSLSACGIINFNQENLAACGQFQNEHCPMNHVKYYFDCSSSLEKAHMHAHKGKCVVNFNAAKEKCF